MLILGGTGFLSRTVAVAALERGHEVTTLTRGVSGEPPAGVRAVRADRNDAQAMAAALQGVDPDAVIDASGESIAAARSAAGLLADAKSYVYVSSLNAYRHWPPGPIVGEDGPLWEEESDDFGPAKAASERILGEVFGGRLLSARAGLIIGPGDTSGRLPWWLHRIAQGGRVVVPDVLEQPMAFVDVRDLSGWLLDAAEQGLSGPVNATGPYGMTSYGGLLRACQQAVAATGAPASELVPIGEAELLSAGVQPWKHLPFWMPSELAGTAWRTDTATARRLGLPSRPIEETVTDLWAWMREAGPGVLPSGERAYGLPAELADQLLA